MGEKSDLIIAPLGEGFLIFVVAIVGWATHNPFVFASLGPTAYELIEKPQIKSAKPYNIIVGHLIGLGAGFFAIWVLNAWGAPKVATAEFVPGIRVCTAVIAVVITTFVTLALKASQPASLATSLLVAIGSMQTSRDAVAIIVAVLIMAAVGEPLRYVRAKHASQQEAS